MPFLNEQDVFIVMAYFRTGVQNENGSWSYSPVECYNQFHTMYPEIDIAYPEFQQRQQRIVDRILETGSLCQRKSTGRPKIVTEEVVADVQTRMERSPNKPLRQLSEQIGFSYGTCQKIFKKDLHMHPYKVSVLQHLLPMDYAARVQYCQWFERNINDNKILDKTVFTDEAWFHLSGYVNSQNYRTWSTNNPHNFVECDLHPIKTGIWVAISRRRIIGPIFFNDTINTIRYKQLILEPFINQLDDEELTEGYFQQDGAPPHTAHATIQFLEQFFDRRIISTGLWPARSPDLTPPDFFLFGYLKNRIYRNRLHNLEELQEAISNEIQNIPLE